MLKKLFFVAAICTLSLTGCNEEPKVSPARFRVYPNPAVVETIVNIHDFNLLPYNIKVIDPKGEVFMEVKNSHEFNLSIPLQGKDAGNYHVVMEAKNETDVVKFIKLPE